MDFVEKIGKTVEEAIREGLIELGATRDNVDIEVIDKGSKGFLGLVGSKMARVRIRKKSNPIDTAVKFLEGILENMKIQADIDVKEKEKGQYIMNLKGKDMGILIGKRGQTLDSLQYLVNLVANKETESFIR